MRRLRRTMRMERLESRSLLAAALGIADVVVDQATGEPQVATSIEIDNAAGIRAATVEILYDPNLLQADLASVRAGTIWEGKGVAIANLNDQDGKVTAFIFATEDMNLSSGTLLDIDFMFHDDSPADARAHLGLGAVRINEGDIPISAAPLPGHKTIDGSITRQAGAALPQLQDPVKPTPQPRSPGQHAVTAPREQPQANAPEQIAPAPQGPVPVVPHQDQTPPQPPTASQNHTPQQQSAAAVIPAASMGPTPVPATHAGFLCAPRSSAMEPSQVDAGGFSDVLPPLVDAAAQLASVQPLTNPIAEAPLLPVAALEEPNKVLSSSVSDSPPGLETAKAKQLLDTTEFPRRTPLMPKALPLFAGSAKSGNTDAFSSALLWMFRRRGVEPQHGSEEAQEH